MSLISGCVLCKSNAHDWARVPETGQALGTAMHRGMEEPHQPSRGESLCTNQQCIRVSRRGSPSVEVLQEMHNWEWSLWSLFAAQSLYQSAQQRQRDLGLNSHRNTNAKATLVLWAPQTHQWLCAVPPAERALTAGSPAPHPSTENEGFWHQSWHKAASFITICNPVSWKIERWLFPPVTGWHLKVLHKFLVLFSKQCSLTLFRLYLIPGPEVEKFPMFGLMAPFRIAVWCWINKSG